MGFRLPGLQRCANVRKGYLAVYVGENKKKRFVIPISYLNQPSFQDLLSQAAQEFGYDIQWVASQFLAQKISSWISLLTCMGHKGEG